MVEKLSLNVEIIPLNIEHNFLIPSDMSVESATALIVKTVLDEYPGVKSAAAVSNMLIQASSGKLLNSKCSFRQLGIIQGEKIILI